MCCYSLLSAAVCDSLQESFCQAVQLRRICPALYCFCILRLTGSHPCHIPGADDGKLFRFPVCRGICLNPFKEYIGGLFQFRNLFRGISYEITFDVSSVECASNCSSPASTRISTAEVSPAPCCRVRCTPASWSPRYIGRKYSCLF